MNKELQKLLNKWMPKRYYGHEARNNAKRIAIEYTTTQAAVCDCERVFGSTQRGDGYYYCDICGIKTSVHPPQTDELYEVDFNGQCKVLLSGNNIQILKALNGWGNPIPKGYIKVINPNKE